MGRVQRRFEEHVVEQVVRDPARLAAVRASGLADPALREALDRWAATAGLALRAPAALVSLVDADRQVLAGVHGLTGPAADRRGTDLARSFCKHVVAGREPLQVEDARAHTALAGSPAVDELGVVAYAGVPITVDGQVVGALCAIEPSPRAWDGADLDVLGHLAEGLVAELALRRCAAEAREAERRLAHETAHDALTGLPGRKLLFDRLGQALARSRRSGAPVAVVVVDLDRLRLVNDELGHDAGDAVLERHARRLAAAVRPGDTLARLGGDEFVVVAEDTGPAEAAALGERLLAELRAPLPGFGVDLAVGVSAGVAVVDGRDVDAREAVRRAEAALRDAKDAGGTGCVVRDAPAAGPGAGRRLAVASALRGALERGELHLVAQPAFSLGPNGTPVGCEILLRWEHPELGLVPPAEFIPIAEDTGLISELGAWVLREACGHAAGDGTDELVSVNVSARQLRDPGFPALVADVLAATGLRPGRLVLEVTETALLEAGDAPVRVLGALRALGAKVGLDDFGTGFSSLALLKKLPLDGLKLDRSFVAGLPGDGHDRAIIAGVVEVGRQMGFPVTAEGIETPAQLEAVRALGCAYAQGFLLARPAPLGQLTLPHA